MTRILMLISAGIMAVLVACTPTPVSDQPANKTVTERAKLDVSVTDLTGDKVGGVLTKLSDDPATLDPHLATDATSAAVIVEVFGGLVTIDPDLKIVPDLAKNWEISPDGTGYTFYMRDNAKFHNGKTVTAEDFKWSIERAADPTTGSPVVDQYLGDIVGVEEKLNAKSAEIQGVVVVDDVTLNVRVDAAKAYFLAKLTYPTAYVLDRENVESGRRWFLTPNGTGPFKLEQYLPGDVLILARHDNYHLGPAFIDKAKFILSGGASMLMYENDEIDVSGVGLADIDRVLDASSPLNAEVVRRPPSFSTSYLGLNVKMPPLDDVKVRQALNYSINREEIATIVLADLVVPAKGILPPGFPAYNPDIRGYPFDIEKARSLLKESKYGDDLDNIPAITLTTPGSFGAANVGLDLEVILNTWREELGMNIEIQQTDFATFLQDLQRRRFHMFDIGWIADYPDPQNFLDILFHSESSSNHTNYASSRVDNLLSSARIETDEKRRFEMYNEVENMILEDAPWVPLWHSGESFVLIKPWVKDFYLPPIQIPQLRYVYIQKQ